MKRDWTEEEVGVMLSVVLDLNLFAAIDGRRARNAQVSYVMTFDDMFLLRRGGGLSFVLIMYKILKCWLACMHSILFGKRLNVPRIQWADLSSTYIVQTHIFLHIREIFHHFRSF